MAVLATPDAPTVSPQSPTAPKAGPGRAQPIVAGAPTVQVPAVTPVPASTVSTMPTPAVGAPAVQPVPPLSGTPGFAPPAIQPVPAAAAPPVPTTTTAAGTAPAGTAANATPNAQQVTQGGASAASTPGVYGQFYQDQPGAQATYANDATGRQVTGTTTAVTMPNGSQIVGIMQADGTLVDRYGQDIDPKTGKVVQTGALPYAQNANTVAPNGQGGFAQQYGSSNATMAPQSLASIIGPSAIMQQGANQASALEQAIDPKSYQASLVNGSPQSYIGGYSAPNAGQALAAGLAPPMASGTGAPSTPASSTSPVATTPTTAPTPSLQTLAATPTTGTAAGPTTNSTLNGLLPNVGATPTGTGVNSTPTSPGSSLLDQTLQGPSVTDPVQNALAGWNTFQQASQPQYNADLRTAMQQAAAGGALGSGMLNTSLGNIANQYQNQLQTAQQSLLENALQQQNRNAYANVGIAQQQQGFQNNQQQEAVQNALQQYLAGTSNNPANTSLLLSQIFGQQATGAGNALSGMISGTQNANAANSQNALIQQLLQGLGGGGSGAAINPATGLPAGVTYQGTSTGGYFG